MWICVCLCALTFIRAPPFHRTAANTSPIWPVPKQNRKITSLWFSLLLIVRPPSLPNCLSTHYHLILPVNYGHAVHIHPAQDVYYKTLDLAQVRKVSPKHCEHVSMCVCVVWHGAQEYVYSVLGRASPGRSLPRGTMLVFSLGHELLQVNTQMWALRAQ